MTTTEALVDAAAVVGDLLGCTVAVTDDPRAHFARLEKGDCFDARAQPALTASWLLDFTTRMEPEVVHELTEPLGVRLVLASLGEYVVVVGPFSARALGVGEAEAVLGGLAISSAALNPYRRYRARLPIVEPEYAVRGVMALAQRAGHAPEQLGVRGVVADAPPLAPGVGEPPQSASSDVVDERYANEQAYMDAVAVGDERGALAALHRLMAVPVTPGYLSTPYVGVTILRIMTRIAAQQAGLPPVVIDAISQTYAQRLHRQRFSADPHQTAPEVLGMVTEFTRRIHEHRQRPYSRQVGEVIDEIELHLSRPVSAASLAGRLHMSESQLARRFKAETGLTIAEYLARQRVKVAARLLATTHHPVRDIAAHVGYPDANYFVKVFRGVERVTPTEYRKQHAF